MGQGKRKEEVLGPLPWGAALEAMLEVGVCCLLSLIHSLTPTVFPGYLPRLPTLPFQLKPTLERGLPLAHA